MRQTDVDRTKLFGPLTYIMHKIMCQANPARSGHPLKYAEPRAVKPTRLGQLLPGQRLDRYLSGAILGTGGPDAPEVLSPGRLFEAGAKSARKGGITLTRRLVVYFCLPAQVHQTVVSFVPSAVYKELSRRRPRSGCLGESSERQITFL